MDVMGLLVVTPNLRNLGEDQRELLVLSTVVYMNWKHRDNMDIIDYWWRHQHVEERDYGEDQSY